MTDSPAPALTRVKLICVCCPTTTHVWRTQQQIAAMQPYWLPLEQGYAYVCWTCLLPAKVAAAAPIKAQRVADPERTLHHRRHTGARAAASVGRMR